MRHGADHILHMRPPLPQAEVALCEPAAFLLLPLDAQTPADMPVLAVRVM
jgi:hypothetical protein